MGCKLNLPDIAVFKGGKIKFVALTGARGEVVVKHSASKLSLHKLRLIFSTKVRKRRLFQAVKKTKPFYDVLSKQASERPTTTIAEKEGDFSYRDVALLRLADGSWSILSDPTFMSTFLKRQNDPYWKDLRYVQTNIKAKLGIGTPYYIQYYAPYN